MRGNNLDPQGVYHKLEGLVENWSDRIGLVDEIYDGKLDYSKKVVLAQCLENTQQILEHTAMNESTDAGATDGFKRFALDIVTAVVPNLVANDIVSVQPINSVA